MNTEIQLDRAVIQFARTLNQTDLAPSTQKIFLRLLAYASPTGQIKISRAEYMQLAQCRNIQAADRQLTRLQQRGLITYHTHANVVLIQIQLVSVTPEPARAQTGATPEPTGAIPEPARAQTGAMPEPTRAQTGAQCEPTLYMGSLLGLGLEDPVPGDADLHEKGKALLRECGILMDTTAFVEEISYEKILAIALRWKRDGAPETYLIGRLRRWRQAAFRQHHTNPLTVSEKADPFYQRWRLADAPPLLLSPVELPPARPEPCRQASLPNQSEVALDTTPDTPQAHIWRMLLEDLQLTLPERTFKTWLQGTRVLQVDNEHWIIQVTYAAAADWIRSRLDDRIKRSLRTLTGAPVALTYTAPATL